LCTESVFQQFVLPISESCSHFWGSLPEQLTCG
jgi:hypothetical protein